MRSDPRKDCGILNYFCRRFHNIAISFSLVPATPVYFIDKSSGFSLGPDHGSVEVLEGTLRERYMMSPFTFGGCQAEKRRLFVKKADFEERKSERTANDLKVHP